MLTSWRCAVCLANGREAVSQSGDTCLNRNCRLKCSVAGIKDARPRSAPGWFQPPLSPQRPHRPATGKRQGSKTPESVKRARVDDLSGNFVFERKEATSQNTPDKHVEELMQQLGPDDVSQEESAVLDVVLCLEDVIELHKFGKVLDKLTADDLLDLCHDLLTHPASSDL